MAAHAIRTTIDPYNERIVDDATFDDLTAQGLILETKATTDAGLLEAAVRQVRDGALDDATRAGIAEADAKRAAQAKRRRDAAQKPGAASPARKRAAKTAAATTTPAGDPAVADTATADGTPSGDAAPADVADTPSGDAPADTTQES